MVAFSAPRRSAVRTESIAVLPPPTTTTLLPLTTGVSIPEREAPIRLTRVRYSLLLRIPTRFSPGIFIKRGKPAPLATKKPSKPSSRRSSIVAVLPTMKFVSNFTPILRRFSISTSTTLLGRRNSGIPYFNTPPIS